MRRWTVREWTITRVPDPGFELILPQDEATTAVLKTSPWLHPNFVTDDWALRVGSSALLVTGPGPTVLVDPWLAFDDPTRFDGRLHALAEAGARPEEIDIVVNSHVDGIGGNVVPDTGLPTFVNATYVVPAAELAAVRAGARPGATALGAIANLSPINEPTDLAAGLALEALPGHNDAHFGLRVGDGALIVGHLFLHPALVANPDNTAFDTDPHTVRLTRRSVLERCVTDDMVLIGPLFEAPGGGHVVRDRDRWALQQD